MPRDSTVIVDTGPLVALFDRDDAYHALCRTELKKIHCPLVTVWPVLTEAMYLLSFSAQVQDNLWEFIMRGGLEVEELTFGDVARLRELMRTYKDRPMDLADAALVRLAERENLRTIFTLDQTDFRIYKPAHVKAFTLIPARLISKRSGPRRKRR